jgi:hypothetical protein
MKNNPMPQKFTPFVRRILTGATVRQPSINLIPDFYWQVADLWIRNHIGENRPLSRDLKN